MPITVNRVINSLTIPVVRFKQQKFGQGIIETMSSIKDEFIRKTPQTPEEIKDYLNKKITSVFDKAEKTLNETYEENGYEYYKAEDRESKIKSAEESKKDILMNIRWRYQNKGEEEQLQKKLPLYEKILNTPEFFEQKLRYSNYSKPYSRGEEYNRYETVGQHLLYSLANHTETPEKLGLLNKFIDTKPDNFDNIKLFQLVLRRENLFPEKANLLEKIITTPSLKEQKTFYICYEKSIDNIGLEALAEMRTPQQVKLLEQIIDDKNKHPLFGAFVGNAIKKMTKEQTEMFSQLIENKDYVERIRSSKFLLESFTDFDDKQSMEMFKTYLTKTNEVYKTEIPKNIAPCSVEYNDMQAMLTIYDKDKKPYAAKVFNKFFDKKLYENPILSDNFGGLLNISKTKEGANIVDKVFDNEKLYNNEKFIKKLTNIFSFEKDGKIEKMRNLYHKYTE